jgi:endonuclease G, mitochondrial
MRIIRIIVAFLSVVSQEWALDLSPIGTPQGGSCTVMDKSFYVICYQPEWKIPEWVAEHVTREQLLAPAVPRKDAFRPDPAVPAGRAELSDYKGSGYDRGHQAPAGDFRYSVEAMRATFLLSNMAPQRPEMNRVIWRDLEVAVRSLIAHEGDAWIITGPVGVQTDQLYVPLVWPANVIGAHQVVVPEAFFKAALCAGKVYVFIVPNQRNKRWTALATYETTLNSVESLTGLAMFRAVVNYIELEGTLNPLPVYPVIGPDAEQTKAIKRK